MLELYAPKRWGEYMPRGQRGYLGRLVTAIAVMTAPLAVATDHAANLARSAQADASVAQKVPVYVSDFELIVARGARSPKKPPAGEAKSKQADLVYGDTDPTALQARLLMDSFANTLVELLQKDGYTATRQKGDPPAKGVLLRGAFTEPDGENRIRRAILGGGSLSPQFILYVGTFNLARQDQPLYVVAPVQSPDPRFGPVITLNAYVPMTKFSVDKDPSGEDVRKICQQIVSQLTTLIGSNNLSLPQ